MSFPIEPQEQNDWCWAAVSNSTDHYYDPRSSLAQCKIVKQVLAATTDCCGSPGACNQPEKLQTALTRIGRLNRLIVGPSDFTLIKSEIDQKRPVCVRIQWFGAGAHFVVISGYTVLASGDRIIEVADSFYGESSSGTYHGIWNIDFDLFPASYQSGGTWSATFLTQSKPGERR